MDKKESDVIDTLKTFKTISFDQNVHPDLLKEKKIILYAATLLDSDNTKILELCLDILENFALNESVQIFLISTFGIYEALEALCIRMRNKNENVYNRATEISEILRNLTPPAYNTRNRVKGSNPVKRNHLFLLHIEDLSQENHRKLENILLKIKGIVSFLIDTELRKCTLRICPKITIKEVIEKIYNKCSLRAVVVTKDKQKGTEVYHDLLEKNTDKSYLQYPEEQSPKGKAITDKINLMKNSNNLLQSVVNFWNESFYW